MIIDDINKFLAENEGNYLEIGVYHGETFFAIAKANPTKMVHGIDPFISDGWTGQYRGTILSEAEKDCEEKMKSHDNAVIFTMTSREFSELLIDRKKMNISVVFIDGSHWLENVQVDVKLAMDLIGEKKGFIIFDDLNLKGVRDGIQEACQKYSNLKSIHDPREYLGIGGYYLVN